MVGTACQVCRYAMEIRSPHSKHQKIVIRTNLYGERAGTEEENDLVDTKRCNITVQVVKHSFCGALRVCSHIENACTGFTGSINILLNMGVVCALG